MRVLTLFGGIIYSDIGTSPLYTLNGIWPPGGAVPSEEDVIGGISAIIWSITLLPLIKYVCCAQRRLQVELSICANRPLIDIHCHVVWNQRGCDSILKKVFSELELMKYISISRRCYRRRRFFRSASRSLPQTGSER